jgi:CelD/BcsL family acetyltransferase involved in cellulose biosynthesis
VPENSVLARIFTEHGFIPKYVTGCVIADFSGLNWKDYLAKRTKNFRRNVRRKHKKIDLRYSVEFNIVSHWKEFDTKFNQMVLMHEDRWQDDRSPAKGAREIACWRQAIKEQFNNQKIAFYQLSFDGDPAAYRLGFLYKGIYYDWHTGFCKDFEEFSPGFLILSYMIQHFIATGIHAINFMAGEYNWKYDWSWDKRKIDNYMFTSRSRGIASTLLNAYHHKIRDKIKSYYHQAMEYKALRAVSRNAILVWQKITGHS